MNPPAVIEVRSAAAVTIPAEQVEVEVVSTLATKSKPVGSASVRVLELSGVEVLGLVIVNESVETPVTRMLEGLNVLASRNGATTVREALAVFPLPPLLELVEDESLKTPTVVAVTVTATVQLAPAASVAPLNVTELDPAVPVAVPPQVDENPLGVAMTSPAGSVSENATPVRSAPPGLLSVTVSEVEVLMPIVELPKAIVMAGGAVIEATSEAELLEEFVSPVTLTEAVLVI